MADKKLALNLLLKAEDRASKVLGQLRDNAGKIAAAIAGFFSGKLLSASIEEAQNLETQYNKLDATIKATGGAAGLTAEEIVEMSKRLDEATTGSASAFRDAANQLLTFKSVGQDAFETTLMLAQDLADAGFGSVTTNAVQLGKALEDPVQGMSSLRESGITFTEQQREVIKSLVETGQQAHAQNIILEAVAGQVGGVAAAAGKGLAGALDLVSKRFTDFKEQLGAGFLPILTEVNNLIADVIGRLNQSGQIQAFSDSLNQGFQSAKTSVMEFVQAIDVNALQKNLTAFASAAKSALTTIKDAFIDLVNLFPGATNDSKNFGEAFNRVMQTSLESATLFVSALSTGINTLKTGFFSLAGAGAAVVSKIMDGVAVIEQGMAKITFGNVSKQWAEAAEKSKQIAESFSHSATVNFTKASQAIDQTADSATQTRTALTNLFGSVEKTGQAATKTAESVGLTADELDALGENAEVVDGKAVKLSQSLNDVGQSATAAKSELKEAAKAGREVESSFQAIKNVDLDNAFKTLGITSQATLEKTTRDAKVAFDTIKNSGTATATDIKNAFAAYLKTAIDAQNGVLTSAQQAEAAQYGVKIAVDETGRAYIDMGKKGKNALDSVILKAQQAQNEFNAVMAAADGMTSAAQQQLDRLDQRNKDLETERRESETVSRVEFSPRGFREGPLSEVAKEMQAQLSAENRDNLNKFIQAYKDELFLNIGSGTGRTKTTLTEATDKEIRRLYQQQTGSPTQIIQIRSPDGSKTANINASDDDAKRLVDILKQFQSVSS